MATSGLGVLRGVELREAAEQVWAKVHTLRHFTNLDPSRDYMVLLLIILIACYSLLLFTRRFHVS